MEAGIDPVAFWNMTLTEITDYIGGYKKRIQWQAIQTYLAGRLFGESLGAAFGEGTFPSIQKVFPNLFDDIPMPESVPPWQILKERILAHKDDYKRNQGDNHDAG